MGTILLTVVGPKGQTDLAVPAEAVIAELIPELVDLCVELPERSRSARWAVGPPEGAPFPPHRTMGELGVVDGALLYLRDMTSPPSAAPIAGAPTGATVARADGSRG